MIVSDLIAYAQRVSGLLGVGQVALPQDTADAQTALQLMLQQWRQNRWLVYRLDSVIFPLIPGTSAYTVGPYNPPSGDPPPDVATVAGYRPANIQSCFLRQELGSGPNSFPIDFPMRILQSRQQYDQIALKSLQSWPSLIYYDPIVPYAFLYVWPIPIQPLFSLYIAFQHPIDLGSEEGAAIDLDGYLPAETQEAIVYNLAARLCLNYAVPVNPALAAAARSSLMTMRTTYFALQPLQMPGALRGTTRLKNPNAGFVETSAGIPVTVLQ